MPRWVCVRLLKTNERVQVPNLNTILGPYARVIERKCLSVSFSYAILHYKIPSFEWPTHVLLQYSKALQHTYNHCIQLGAQA